jgi:hypothetical protein
MDVKIEVALITAIVALIGTAVTLLSVVISGIKPSTAQARGRCDAIAISSSDRFPRFAHCAFHLLSCFYVLIRVLPVPAAKACTKLLAISSVRYEVVSDLLLMDDASPKMRGDIEAVVSSDRQIELRLRLDFVLQRGQRDPQKPAGLGSGISFWSKATDRRFEVAAARHRDGNGPAPRDDLEVVELHLQRHRPSPAAGALAVPPYFVDEGFELGDHGAEFGEVGRERVLGAERAGRILCRPVLGGLHHEYVRI